MTDEKLRSESDLGTQRLSQWEDLMRKFSQSRKEKCKTPTLDLPRVQRSIKHFPTGSQYEGSWDLLGMSGYGVYKFPNGVIYQGNFEDGMFQGIGELLYPSGIILRGKWKKGVLSERTLLFADGLEYSENNWSYCKKPDRRFSIERIHGLQPAGNSYLTADQPKPQLPPGYYDTGDGFYDPKTKVVYKADDLGAIIRSPSKLEQAWIIENCRSSYEGSFGPRPDLYEKWMNAELYYPSSLEQRSLSDTSKTGNLLQPSVEKYQGSVEDFTCLETVSETSSSSGY